MSRRVLAGLAAAALGGGVLLTATPAAAVCQPWIYDQTGICVSLCVTGSDDGATRPTLGPC